MNNAAELLKSLITYAIVVPAALLVGYMLTNPLTVSTFFFVGAVACVLIFPLLTRWHYPILLFSWSAACILFFVKGVPNVGQVMIVISLGLSIVEHIMNPQRHFLRVPSVTVPLLALAIVAVITAKMTGGIGMHALGSDVYGGRKYMYLFLGIAGYFALTSRAIPPEKARFYAGLYFLGGVTTLIGDLFPYAPTWSYMLFHLFPPSAGAITGVNTGTLELGTSRLGGIGNCALVLYLWFLARYGLRGIFLEGKLWRPVLLGVFGCLIMLGGYRTAAFLAGLAFIFMFFAERLYRTPMLGVIILAGTLGVVLLFPLANKLPFTFQRSLAFLPLHLDPVAKQSAESSTDWRIAMWTALLPQIPQHLLLGKGFAISPEDYDEMMGGQTAFKSIDAGAQSLALAGDYHNGMISVVLSFGIWGVVVILWFMFAGFRVVYLNMRYGRPELYTINAMLFLLYFNEAGSYLCCLGGLGISSDMALFVGPLGMSIALNHGVCRPAPKPVALVETAGRRRLVPPVPAFQ